jgi:hypothetical protein
MDALRAEIVRDAVARGVIPVIASALAVRHPIALGAHEALRKQAYAHLIGQ